MQIHLEQGNSVFQITKVTPTAVWVNEDDMTSSFILWPDHCLMQWRPRSFEDLCQEDFLPLIHRKTSILLLSTGEVSRLPNYSLLAPLYAAGIGVELMTQNAACRTFGVLATEGRSVACAIFLSNTL